jgi:hypothetical protein
MGSVLAATVSSMMVDQKAAIVKAVTALGAEGAPIAAAMQAGTLPKVSSLPLDLRTIIEVIYGQAVADIFLIAVPLAIITVVAVLLLPNEQLGTKTASERLAEQERDLQDYVHDAEEVLVDVAEAMVGGVRFADEDEQALPEAKAPRSS